MRFLILIIIALAAGDLSAQSFSTHLRIEPRRGAVAGWRDTSGREITVKFQEIKPDNSWSPVELRVDCNGTRRLIQWPAGVSLDAVSLMLTATPDSAVLTLAHTRDRLRVALPGAISADAEPETIAEKCRVLRDECIVTPAPAAAATVADRFGSVESLMQYLKDSSDPMEAVWTHYDHKTKPLRGTPGGFYTLATIAREDSGVYDIVYLHGAESEAPWQPLDVKGSLTPTPLSGIYDLAWLTADRIPISHRSWASMTDGLLTLCFPQWEATLRFAPVAP